MNERVKELAEQALQKCMDENGFLNNTNWRINADYYAESEVFEKFAELIVQKLDDILILEYLDCVGNKDKKAEKRVQRLREKVKTYFGVEE